MTAQSAEVLDSAYARDRAFMVERHLRARGICDPLLLVTMGAVPRETFPHVPEALRQQLAIGGQLIILIGPFGNQTLMRVRHTGEDRFEEEDFGAVACH